MKNQNTDMKYNITLAIPFYNSSEYIEDAVRIPLFDDRVDEILIVDDCSSDEEYEKLVKKIDLLLKGDEISFDPNFSLSPNKKGSWLNVLLEMTKVDVSEQATKIKIMRNEKNLGGFQNKYKAVKESKNEWVYLLDSDNFLVESSISALYNIEEWDHSCCYCPSVLMGVDGDWDQWNHRRFGYDNIDIEKVKILFDLHYQYQNECGTGLGVNGFLNTGNFFVNKNHYIDALKNSIEEDIEPYAADVLAFSYYWLLKNNTFKIVPDLYYYHRHRPDSFWQRTGNYSGLLSQQYEKMIRSL